MSDGIYALSIFRGGLDAPQITDRSVSGKSPDIDEIETGKVGKGAPGASLARVGGRGTYAELLLAF
jgi:hypothetical protein